MGHMLLTQFGAHSFYVDPFEILFLLLIFLKNLVCMCIVCVYFGVLLHGEHGEVNRHPLWLGLTCFPSCLRQGVSCCLWLCI